MARRFLSNVRINDAYTFPASDGNDGQVITTDGAGNLAFENISPDAASVIYRDNFTGDGSTVTFDLQNSITDEDQTQIYIDGVYQEKSTYSISGTTITFTTAPISGHSVEVISISSINTGPTVLYQDNFTGNGSDTAFTLGQEIDNEIKTFIFLNGVYQFKNTYTVDGTTLTFDTAPANSVAIEVVSIASAVQSDSLQAGAVIIPVKNTHTASIAKGTPVYITGNVGASERLQIAPADASNSAKMPAAGLLLTTLAVNAEGYAITGGYLRNITTDTIDGTGTSSNDTVYVKAGGGLTMTKPTGSNLIQNIAKVARSASGSSGSLLVSSILRTNDIPNLTTGKIWVGSANNTIESGTLHLDESNNRLGINNNSPNYSLDVTGDANISSNVIIGGNLTVDGTQTILNTQTVEVEDNILQLNTTQGSPDTATATTSGISIYRGDGVTQASFIFDDADDTWDLTNNLVVDGNVGIGTTSPDRSLDVEGNGMAIFGTGDYTELMLRGQVEGTGTVRNVGAFHWSIRGDVGGDNDDLKLLRFVTGTYSGIAMQIQNSTGNVGIGQTSPTAKLQILGNAANYGILSENLSGYGAFQLKSTTVAQTWSIGALDNGSNSDLFIYGGSSAGTKVILQHTGNVGIGTSSPTTIASGYTSVTTNGTNGGGLVMQVNGTATGYVYAESGALVFTNTSGVMQFYNAGSERMRITSGGNINIGSGSLTQVAYQLRVDADVDNGIYLSAGSSSSNHALYVENTSGSAEHLAVRGDGQIRLNASSVGRVLVGTTVDSTYDRLQVTGNAWIGANATQGIRISNNGANGSIVGINQALSAYTALELRASGTNGQLFLATDGNVGVGRTDPNARLDIKGAGGGTGLTFETSDASNNQTFYIQDGGRAGLKYWPFTIAMDSGTSHATDARFQVATTSGDFVVLNDGKTGIGETSPDAKLHIVTSDQNIAKFESSNSDGPYTAYYQGSTPLGFIGNAQGLANAGSTNMCVRGQSELVFAISSSEKMRIDSSGQVGIGTTLPDAKLSIAAAGANGLQLEPDTGSTNNSARLFWKASSGAWAIMNNSQNFSIRSGAVVGSTSGTEKIRLTGYSATSWTSGSDETMKENIIPVGNVLDKIQNYRCVEYNFIDDETADKKIGFIAQDWQEDFPQIIEQMENEKIGMKYTETIPILLKAIQELKAEIETLKTQINN